MKYTITERFRGYVSLTDKTNLDDQYLTIGSKNVLINDQEKVKTREGYELFGAALTAQNPIQSSYDWYNSKGLTINLRKVNTVLQWYSNLKSAWTQLAGSWTSTVEMAFKERWDNAEKIDVLYFVAQDDNLHEWNGAEALVESVTANTITLQGTSTWADRRFYTTRSKSILINGTEYTYSGGETTTTLTGVSPDPSSNGVVNGDLAFQKIVTIANCPEADFTWDIIGCLENQIYIGDSSINRVYISNSTDNNLAASSFTTSFAPSTARAPGAAALLFLDSAPLAFVPFEQEMAISCGLDDWYQIQRVNENNGATIYERMKIKKFKTSALLGAKHHALVTRVGNAVCYIAQDNTLRMISRIENFEEPQFTAISNPIKTDFDAETFTNGAVFFNKNRILIAAPTNGTVYIMQIKENELGQVTRYWQPPQILPIRRFMARAGVLFGHSSGGDETYELFTGTNDNGKPMEAKAVFAYQNFGDRANQKSFDKWFVEGYIAGNTTITATANFEYDGSRAQREKTIRGNDQDITLEQSITGSLGTASLGADPIGATLVSSSGNLKFRVFLKLAREDFFEFQPVFSSNDTDYAWEILAFGTNSSISKNLPIKISK